MIRERLLQYLEYKRVSKYKFYQITGLSNGFLDKKGAIGSDKCELILSYFPDLNPEWFLLGKGDMIKNINSEPPLNPKEELLKDELIKSLKSNNEILLRYNKRLEEDIEELKRQERRIIEDH